MSLRHKTFADLAGAYLRKLRELAQDADASQELSLRPALNIFVEGFNKVLARDDLKVITEPLRKSYGTPDYKLKTERDFLIGYIEAKGLSADLRETEKTEQIERYRSSGKRFVLTNHLDFWLFDYASDGKTILHTESVTLLPETDFRKNKTPDPADIEALYRLLDRFLREARPEIATPKELAERLAASAREICDLLRNAYQEESEHGDLHELKTAFEQTLLPELAVEQFTDMYAQTLTYGLFAAAVNHRLGLHKSAPLTFDNAWRDIPKTNPFLRKLFESVTGSALEGKDYRWIIEDLVHLLNAVDLGAILEGFGRRTAQQDPVVHFYEDFLAAYDPKLREARGVYYTPEPVVSYIVRSVDYLLRERFGCPEGLADAQRLRPHPLAPSPFTERGRPQAGGEVPHRVLILDPACGTGTFLYFVIDLIRQQFIERNEAGMWADYVREHLLPRVFGFELLMAPYTVAHLKLGMELAGLDLSEGQRARWAYNFEGDERLGIYLTNTLEEPRFRDVPFPGFWRIITEEANAAARVKRDLPILVVLGNPPYSCNSANTQAWITRLVQEDYYPNDDRKEANPRLLLDDYVKFLRWGQWRIEQTGQGILAFISNHGYLDNPTFRQLRQRLMKAFDLIYLLDLHGNSKKKEVAPDGRKDKNVFDIQQGVAIGIFAKLPQKTDRPGVFHAHLWGTREGKYEVLQESDISMTQWTGIQPQTPFYLFVPQDNTLRVEFERLWNLCEALPLNSAGVKTNRDHLLVDFEQPSLVSRIQTLISPDMSDEEIRRRFELEDNDYWNTSRELTKLRASDWEASLCAYLYRPFDFRTILYQQNLIEIGRGGAATKVMGHMRRTKNLAFCIGRQGQVVGAGMWNLVFVSKEVTDTNLFYRGGIQFLPLYLCSEGELELHKERHLNLSPAFLKALAEKLGLAQTEPHGLPKGITPEDIFHYIYAVLHSPTYRQRYKEFLKIDFPRVPLTSKLDLFKALCQKGADLVALHLLKPDYAAASWNQNKHKPSPFANISVRYPVPGENEIAKGHPKYLPPGKRVHDSEELLKEGRVYINAHKPGQGKQGQYFEGVPLTVWEFQVGGYQVCQKWLKDRQGRKLSLDDREHYKKIVMALGETIRLMREIDAVIERHSGWPIW